MQGHEGDDAGAVLVLVGDLVGVGDEGDLLQELGERAGTGRRRALRRLGGRGLARLLELQGHGCQFLEVLDPRLVLRVGRGLEFGEVAGALKDGLQHHRRAGARVDDRTEFLHQRVEPLHGVGGAGRHAEGLVDAPQRLREGDLLAQRECVDHRLGTLSDAALGHVQDAAQRDVVLRVREDAQVREDVADLLALVEADAADDLVGQADPDEDLLEHTGLGVGPVEDRDVAGLGVAGVGEPVDLVGDELGLVVLGVRDVAGDDGSAAGLGPQVLGAAVLVALDDGVGGGEDRLRGAVVLFQQDRRRVLVVLLELEDVADRRAAEGVDRLVGVTHHAQLGRGQVRVAGADQLAHQRVLRVVGVLVLVDQDVAEAAPVVLGDVREGLEEVDGGHDDVVEVEGVGLAQPPLVHRVRLRQGLLKPVGSLVGEGLFVYQLVLQVRDLGVEGLRRELLRVQVQVPADERHQALGVGRVVDRERGREAEPLGLAAQDAHARAVEGGDPHGVGARADQALDALLHLTGGLVGEGDRQDLAGVDVPGGQQVADPVGQDPGLAGAGAGHDEQRGARVHHGGGLLLVQAVQERRRVDDGLGGAVPVVRVPGHGHVEVTPEEVVRTRLRGGVLLGRRGDLVGGGEVRQEAVVKEAAHRIPSLGGGTDRPARVPADRGSGAPGRRGAVRGRACGPGRAGR